MTSTIATQPGVQLAERLGLDIVGREGHDLKCPCVSCESSDAMRVHQKTGVSFCYSCNTKLSRLQLAETVLGNQADAWRLLEELGLEQPRRNGRHTGNGKVAENGESALQQICRAKKMPPASAIVYGATEKKWGDDVVLEFPVYDELGKQCGRFAIPPGDGKGLFAKGSHHGLFLPHENGEVVLPQENEEWLMPEGVKDAAAFHGLGCKATGLPTCAMNERFAPIFRGVDLRIVPDLDTPAINGTEKTASRLAGITTKTRIVRLPGEIRDSDGVDIRDILAKENGEKLLRQAIDEATEWKAGGKPGDKPPPYETFPIGVFPSPIRDYITAGARALGCDESFLALPLLSSLAAAVGNTRRVRLKSSWHEPCVLWTAIIGPSGTMKSPAWEMGVRFTQELQNESFRDYVDQEATYERDKLLHETDLADWKRKGRKNNEPPPVEPERPSPERLLCSDATVEAVATILEENPRGVLLARDELSGWITSFDAYKSTRGADVAHWLSMHRAGVLIIDRKTGRRIIHIPRAATSIAGCVQPGILQLILVGSDDDEDGGSIKEHLANGLAARLLMACPPVRAKQWTDDTLSDNVVKAARAVFRNLCDLEAVGDAEEPIDIQLDAEARAAFIDFYNENASEQVKLDPTLSAAWSKLEGYAARFALLIHLLRAATGDADSCEIDVGSMRAGITLSRWFGGEAVRIYAVIGAAKDTPENRQDRKRRRLVKWIKSRGGTVTVRDMISGPRRYRVDAEAAETVLNELAKAGCGEWQNRPPGPRGGRPTRIFVVREDGSTTPPKGPISDPLGSTTPKNPANIEVSVPLPLSELINPTNGENEGFEM